MCKLLNGTEMSPRVVSIGSIDPKSVYAIPAGVDILVTCILVERYIDGTDFCACKRQEDIIERITTTVADVRLTRRGSPQPLG